MGLPPQEEFTLEDAAHDLNILVSHVEELVSTGKFQHIIVKGIRIVHFYFDKDLFGERRPQSAGYSKEDIIQLTKQVRTLMTKDPDCTPNKVFAKEAERRIDRIQKNIPEDDNYWRIGPNESAFLWQPSDSKKWNRPENGIIYIPREALEAFKKVHGLQNERTTYKSKKKDRDSEAALPKIVPKKLYSTSWIEKFLKLTRNHVDKLLRSCKLKVLQLENKQWRASGQDIIDYKNLHRPEP